MRLSGQVIIESAGDDYFNVENFNESLSKANRGLIVCRGKIHGKSRLPAAFWTSRLIDIYGENPTRVHDELLKEIAQLMRSLRDDIIDLRKQVGVTVRLSVGCHDDIQYYDYEINEGSIVEKSVELYEVESRENYGHPKPYARGGLWLDEKTIQLMADIGAQLDLDEYFEDPRPSERPS